MWASTTKMLLCVFNFFAFKTLRPLDCLDKSDIKLPLCAAIFRSGIVDCAYGKVVCGLCDAHVRIICPVRDVTHVRKCTRPSPASLYCNDEKPGEGL